MRGAFVVGLVLMLLGLAPYVHRFALARADYPESQARSPIQDTNPRQETLPRSCGARSEGYYYCWQTDQTAIDSFFLTNDGVNRIVTSPENALEGFPERWFEFNFSNLARQDLFFTISDMPSKQVGDYLESYFMIFPRKALPAIRIEGTKYKVSLPNEETVEFDARTHEIVGGVFAETGPLELGIYPRLDYAGNGVLIRVNQKGNDPRIGTMATITKGSQKCEVPSQDLWEQTGVIHFLFPKDQEFDQFLQSRCGFGV